MAESESRRLHVVMYHYVRDLPRTRFPAIKGMLTGDFQKQVAALIDRFEMATLDSAVQMLQSKYQPKRDLCLLTFDDGLRDHYTDVLPILVEHGVQGLFFLITGCIEERRVAAVHKNHFLLAELGIADYQSRFLNLVADTSPHQDLAVSDDVVRRTYRWDTLEVARFKYLFNFKLPQAIRDGALDVLFREVFGDESSFAAELYLNWSEARNMIGAGMAIGGHTHDHAPLTSLSDAGQHADLTRCAQLLTERLTRQPLMPFSYPYGKADTFNETTIALLRECGFSCGFCTEVGANEAEQDLYRIKRIDPKDV